MNLREDFYTIQNAICRTALVLVASAALTFWQQAAHAQSAESLYSTEVPVHVSLPSAQAALDQSLLKIFSRALESGLKFQEAIPDIELNDPYPMKISGVELRTSVRGRAGVDGKGPWLEGWIGGLEVRMNRLSIDTVIVREISGVRARIQLKASCDAMKLSWGAKEIPFFARTRLLVEEKQPRIRFDQLSLSMLYEEPEVSLRCEGPLGVEDMMKSEILKAVLNRWTDRSFLDGIQNHLERSVMDALAPGGRGFAGFRTLSYIKGAAGVRLKGAFKVSLDRPIVEVPVVDLPDSGVSSDEFSIRVAVANLESLAQSYFAPGVWSNWTLGQDVQGFRDLMDSRFKQFFAFPDLMRYPKNAPFAFSTTMASRVRLACEANTRQLEVRADIGSWMVLQQPQDSGSLGLKPIVYFGLPTRLRAGKDFQPRVISMGLSSKFHEKYVAEENPSTDIAHDTILESLQPEFEKLLSQSVSEFGILQLTRGLELECDAASGAAIIRVTQ